MSEQLWYYLNDGNQAGPVTHSVLRGMAQEGRLGGDDLVWGPGLQGWSPARGVEGILPAAGPPPPLLGVGSAAPAVESPLLSGGRALFQRAADQARRIESNEEEAASLPHVRLTERLLDLLSGVFRENLDRLDRLSRTVGHLVYVAAALLLFLFFAVLAVKQDSMQLFFIALFGILPGATVAHYTAVRFLSTGARLIETMPSRLFSQSLPRSVGLIAIAASLYPVTFGAYQLIKGGEWGFFWVALCLSAILLYVGGVALNPRSLNIEVDDGTGVGEEGLGILKFAVKILLRMSPVVFGVGAIAGTAAGIYLLVVVLKDEFIGLNFPILGNLTTIDVATDVILLGFVPFLAHVAFVLCYLLLDVLRAVLDVPERLDGVREAVTGTAESAR